MHDIIYIESTMLKILFVNTTDVAKIFDGLVLGNFLFIYFIYSYLKLFRLSTHVSAQFSCQFLE